MTSISLMLSDEIPEDVIVLTWQELVTPKELLHSFASVPTQNRLVIWLIGTYNF